MGYKTDFNIRVTDVPDGFDASAILDSILETAGYSGADVGEFDVRISGKWYDWERDLRKVSAEFPQVRLHVEAEGEEGGDLWEAHFVGGKMQKCPAEIIYAPFDPEKLS
ncbi:hypothetical protein [Cupriavidus sp. DL-D2]|uniref:hypothetical protein n=1 Tax=Cupriavidus sp. DL-D2 TaxID=3144974 RepID=UPI003213818E